MSDTGITMICITVFCIVIIIVPFGLPCILNYLRERDKMRWTHDEAMQRQKAEEHHGRV